MLNEEILECLKWVAIGHEEEVTEYGDTAGYRCVFPQCSYNTSLTGKEHENHSDNCLMFIARKELSALGKPLRRYDVAYIVERMRGVSIENMPEHLKPAYNLTFQLSFPDREYTAHEEIYTTAPITFSKEAFAQEKQMKEQARYADEYVKVIVDPQRVTIVLKEVYI